ncbi:MAG: SRPBCC domain-containing protein [bacterium]|nr:SRPBCC domain-containing protein [bacterium]
MVQPLYIENSIAINAPIEKVWEALIQPEYTKQYMFGCETVSDWQIGSSLIWKMEYEGKEIIPVIGYIIRIEPFINLTYSVFDPNSDMADIKENYLNVVYDLNALEGQTILKVKQGDYSTVANGEQRYKESYNEGKGWQPILEHIKTILETP